MSYSTKNKLLIGLILLLLLANIATISIFWMGRNRQQRTQGGQPAAWLIKELNFDAGQQEKYMQLVQAHRRSIDSLRPVIANAKEDFYQLLQQPALTAAEKKAAADSISRLTEQIDIITFDHFKKVRLLCNAEQQKKFDAVIRQVLQMIGNPAPGVQRPARPARWLQEDDGPPPPSEGRDGPPPGREESPPPPPR